MTTEDRAKLESLLTEACNLSFNCGEWDGDELAEYRKLFDQSKSAMKAVVDFVDLLNEKAYKDGQLAKRKAGIIFKTLDF